MKGLHKLSYVGAILAALLPTAPAGAVNACNDAPGTHERGVTRFAETAIALPHLLLAKGTAANQVVPSQVTTRPVGAAFDACDEGDSLGMMLLGGNSTLLLVASVAIAAQDPLFTAADGKVSNVASSGAWFVGHALTAADGDGDEIEADTVKPVKAAQSILVATANTTVSALQVLSPGLIVSNAGATGAVTFSLPPAVPGMRIDAVVEAAQALQLDPNGTETIALPSTGVQGAAGKYLTANALPAKVNLVCITAGTWDSEGYSGVWTAEA